jgi:outer membrane protein TolC
VLNSIVSFQIDFVKALLTTRSTFKDRFFVNFKIFFCILLLSNNVFAGLQYEWFKNVLQHPNVIIKKAAIEEQYWQIEELIAQKGFDVGISTVGDIPIFSVFDVDFDRATNSQAYLDVVISGSYTLYDFGQAQETIDAEKALQNVARLELVSAAEEELSSLLIIALNHQETLDKLALAKITEPQLLKLKKQLISRFESGIGTITDVRRIQIQLLELASEIELLENNLLQTQLSAAEQYGLTDVQLITIQRDVALLLVGTQNTNIAQRSKSLSELKIQAIMHRQASTRAQSLPTMEGELTSTLYDVTRSFSNHNIGGQLKLKMPLYDSGYSKARIAKLQQASLSEVEANRQVLRYKQTQLNQLQREVINISTRQTATSEKLLNLRQQLTSLQLALGKTSNDINGVGSLINQVTNAQTQNVGLLADKLRNNLERLVITEQLLNKLSINIMDYI